MENSETDILTLGCVRFDLGARRLSDARGQDLPLRPQSLSVLGILADHQGQMVTKNELIKSAWGAVHVTDDSLIQCIADIRKAISDDAHAIVQTVPRFGYKLVATEAVAESAVRERPRWLFPSLIVAMLAAAAIINYSVGIFRATDGLLRPSIAVLPFDHIAEDDNQVFFTDGVSKSITANLSRFEGLFVVSSHSAFQYRDSDKPPSEIAGDLGVRYLLSGDVEYGGELMLIRAVLTDTSNGQALWAEDFTAPRTGVLGVQNEVSARIATMLVQQVEVATSRWARSVTSEDLSAYELALLSEPPPITLDGLSGANALLDRAIELSPGFPLAHSLRAKNDLLLWRHSLAEDLDAALQSARTSAARAIELDNNSSEAHHTLSQINLYADRDHVQALANLTTALQINPNDADLMVRMSTLLGFMNRDGEALEWIAKAMRQNPLHPVWYQWNAAFVYEVAGEHEKAILASKKALSVYESSASIRRILIAAHGHLDQWDQAERYAAEIMAAYPDFTLSSHMRNSPFMDPEEKAEYWQLFRRAGLPE